MKTKNRPFKVLMSHAKVTVPISVLLSVLTVLTSCSSSDEPQTSNERIKMELTPMELTNVEENNDFGINMLKKLSESNNGNLVFSPTSASMAVTLLANIAEDNKRAVMLKALGMEGKSIDELNAIMSRLMTEMPRCDSRNKLSFANGIWFDRSVSLSSSYISSMSDLFNASVTSIDLEDSGTKNIIDSWCRKHTDGAIDDIFEPGDASYFMANAMSFDGEWSEPFDSKKSVTAKFNNFDGTVSDVKMMKDERDGKYIEGENYRAVALPYACESYYGVFILPDETVSCESLVSALSAEEFTQVISRPTSTTLVLSLPNVDLGQREINLSRALLDLGMGEDGDETTVPNFNMDIVKQFACLKIDEEGTQIKVVTTGIMDTMNFPQEETKKTFTVDRPFVFTVVHTDTKSIILTALINKL